MKKYFHIIPVIVISALIFLGIALARERGAEGKAGSSAETMRPAACPVNEEALFREGKKFSSWLNQGRNPAVVPSVVAGIVKGDRLVFSAASGADTGTTYGVASLSKTFTAVLALRLAEEGLLELDARADFYLPGLKIARPELGSEPVTVRHLLAHTSGLPTFGKNYRTYTFQGQSVSIPEQTNPAGYCYAYSNPGFVLMKFVLEAATGKSYEENLKRCVLDPLEMHDTTGLWSNGTGGIRTTLDDLVKYTAMLIGRGTWKGRCIISPSSFAEMLVSPVERPKTRVDYHYSLSWEVITVEGSVDSYYKAGRWYGEASAVQIFPREQTALIYLCNPPQHLTRAFMSWRGSLTGRLRHLVRVAEDDPGICRDWPSLTPGEMKRYRGTYRSEQTGKTITVSYRGGSLYSDIYGAPRRLTVYSANRLLLGKSQKLHSFVWHNNRVIGLSLTGGFFPRLNR